MLPIRGIFVGVLRRAAVKISFLHIAAELVILRREIGLCVAEVLSSILDIGQEVTPCTIDVSL